MCLPGERKKKYKTDVDRMDISADKMLTLTSLVFCEQDFFEKIEILLFLILMSDAII